MARPPILTSMALERVAEMVNQGVSATEIADELGCTLGTLRVRCSQSRISLRRKARQPGVSSMVPRRSSHGKLTLPLPPETLSQLNEWSTLRGVSAASLAAKLLTMIARDGLLAAVLDEH
jgi:hypothetical protein